MFGYCNRAMLTGTPRSAAGGWEVGAGRGHCVSSRAVSTEWGRNVSYTQGRPAVAVRRALSFPRIRLRVFRTSCDRPLSCQMSDVRACSSDRRFWHREGPPVAGGMAGGTAPGAGLSVVRAAGTEQHLEGRVLKCPGRACEVSPCLMKSQF